MLGMVQLMGVKIRQKLDTFIQEQLSWYKQWIFEQI